MEHLLAKAGAAPGANAVTFVVGRRHAADVPAGLRGGAMRCCPYGSTTRDLSASVGGSNQLWMTKAPANYFVRGVVEIVWCPPGRRARDSEVAADEHPNKP